MTPEHDDDHYRTRRESEILFGNIDERNAAHLREHAKQAEAIDKALAAKSDQQQQHDIAHDKAHEAHEQKHQSEGVAVHVALDALDRERKIHADAHYREHEGHQREHGLNNLAIDKAEAATDKRFSSVNGTRAQMEDMLRHMTSQDAFDAHISEFMRFREDLRTDQDRRFDEMRLAIVNIEKGNVKQEGKGIGQAAVVAAIVGAVAAASAIIGLIVVIANIVTA